MSDIWYYALEGKSVGPLSLADLTLILSRVSNAQNVLVWREGFEQWQRAAIVPELAASVIKPPQPPPLPPPLPALPRDLPREPSAVPALAEDHEDRPQYQQIREGRVGPTGKHKNIIVAVVLSSIVLIAWQYYFTMPQEKARQEKLQQEQAQQQQQQTQLSPQQVQHLWKIARTTALANSPRVPIATESLQGSIALKGARIDDLALVKFREMTDPKSPPIELLSPSGSPDPFYAEFGWTNAVGVNVNVPTAATVWKQTGSGALSVGHPVTLSFDNGQGQEFHRTIAVDDKYLFTVKDEVVNKSDKTVSLFPFALISRHGTPTTSGHYLVHEGLIGKFGDESSKEVTYKTIEDKKINSFNATNAWLGITDQYWAAVLLPNNDAHVIANFRADKLGMLETYQTDYLLDARTIAPGATGSADARLFVGAKEVRVVNDYESSLNLNHFDLLIDWGWFYFITKPLFFVIDYIYRLVGNFGVALLIVTFVIKIIFVPFANQSYRSMIKMQRLQPQVAALRERIPEQEQANKEIIELYNREKVTAPSGCLPIVLQTLLFFSFSKMLFVTIETHASFFGWIYDLAAADPTNVFNLFGLIPFDPMSLPVVGHFLHIGAWPVVLGLTIWQLQRKISPVLLGSFQRIVYDFLPIIVCYFSANRMAAIVVCLAFYNLLSIIHQFILMKTTKGVVGNINKYSAGVLPYGKIQPIVFLMMLAPILLNIFFVLVFWRRSKTPTISK